MYVWKGGERKGERERRRERRKRERERERERSDVSSYKNTNLSTGWGFKV
jgi:hypothetical protein